MPPWLTMVWNSVSETPRDILLTIALGLALLLLAGLASRWVSHNHRDSLETQRIWRLTFRNIAVVGFLLATGVIWKEHLQTFMVALGAATVGVLMAFREAFLSLLAFWVRVVKRNYNLGDFIEIDGVRGEVLDITWQHTKLVETGPGKDSLHYSGRVVHIPNNRMLLAPLFVDNYTGNFGAHVFVVPLGKDADILAADTALMAAASKICAPFYDDARQHMKHQRRAHAIDTPSVEPKSRIRFSEDGAPVLVLRIVVPSREKLKLEQLIIREYLASGLQQVLTKHT